MRFVNLFLIILVTCNSIQPFIEDTEFANSVDDFITIYKTPNSQTKKPNYFDHAIDAAVDFFSSDASVAKIATEVEARNYIKYASAAYCAENRVKDWNCANCNGYAAGVEKVEYFSDPSTKTAGYLAVDTTKKLIVLSYRGSKNIVNWLYNLDAELIPVDFPSEYPGAKIHSGFNKMADNLLPKYIHHFNSAVTKYRHYKVVFTGHSLGGALATLSADKLVRAGLLTWDKVTLITYGQPRVGNPKFAAYLDSKPWTFTRVTSYGDLVAISPGRTFGYKHNQHNMHINKNGETIDCSKFINKLSCTFYPLGLRKEAHFTYWGQRMITKC